MNQPEGFDKPDEEQKVCKLKKALYGLKQSARSRNQKIDYVQKSHGFKQSEADLCLYTKQCNDALLYVSLYVDDFLICGNVEMIKETADMLNVYIRFIRKRTSVDKPLLEYMNKKLNTR